MRQATLPVFLAGLGAFSIVGLGALSCSDRPAEDADLGGAAPEWRLEFVGRIGSLDDPDEALTRVTQVLVGPHGELVVAQPMDGQILVFDAAGELTARIGRRGEGPGEFGSLNHIGLLGDTVYAADNGLRRVSFFTLGGQLLETLPWATRNEIRPPGEPSWMATAPQVLLPDGTALLQSGAVTAMFRLTGTVTSSYSYLFLRIDREVEEVDTVLLLNAEYTRTGVPVEGTEYRFACPFESFPLAGLMLDGSGVAVVNRPFPEAVQPDDFQVVIVGPSADTAVVRSFPYDPVPLPESALQEAVHRIRSTGPERNQPTPSPAEVEGALRSAGCLPPALPTVTALVPTQDGSIWLRREVVPGDSVTWTVLDAHAQAQGTLRLPADETVAAAKVETVAAAKDETVAAAKGETVVTVRLDELDVPYLVRYRLLRY